MAGTSSTALTIATTLSPRNVVRLGGPVSGIAINPAAGSGIHSTSSTVLAAVSHVRMFAGVVVNFLLFGRLNMAVHWT